MARVVSKHRGLEYTERLVKERNTKWEAALKSKKVCVFCGTTETTRIVRVRGQALPLCNSHATVEINSAIFHAVKDALTMGREGKITIRVDGIRIVVVKVAKTSWERDYYAKMGKEGTGAVPRTSERGKTEDNPKTKKR